MILMREVMNPKQTQVHPGNPSQGWLRSFVQSRSRHLVALPDRFLGMQEEAKQSPGAKWKS